MRVSGNDVAAFPAGEAAVALRDRMRIAWPGASRETCCAWKAVRLTTIPGQEPDNASRQGSDPMLAFAPTSLTPVLATAGIGWLYYRRIRRQFGRQQYQPRRAMLRVGLLTLVSCALLVMALVLPEIGAAIALGLVVGCGLGALALRHVAIEAADGVRWYTPNPWIGGALSLLLVGRLAWRFGHGAFATGGAQAAQDMSPLTLGIAATLVGFYVVNGVGLALRMRALVLPVKQNG
jgi:hypothetical protein